MVKRLTYVGIGIVLLLVLALAVPAGAVSDTYGNVSFHPFTTDAANTTCLPWTEPSQLATRNCDPVDLVFVGRTVTQVATALRQRGWSRLGSGSTQTLHFANPSAFVAQNDQLFSWDGFFSRYHVRLWQVPGITGTPVVVAAVHHERTLFTDTVDRSWEVAEAFVAGQLCRNGAARCSSTPVLAQQLSIQGGTGVWRGLANDARATVITF